MESSSPSNRRLDSLPLLKAGGWRCPGCQRKIPGSIDVCRCGGERSRFEEMGLNVALAPDPVESPEGRATSTVVPGVAGILVGYRTDDHVSSAWRIALALLFLILVSGAGYGIATYTHLPLPPTRENVVIVTTLEDHTKNAGATVRNAIPGFIALPGTLAAFEPTMTANDLLTPVSETDLEKGFCSASLAKQIRYEFPGFYETWPDDRLERVALEKYPEFQDRLCVLPSQLGVSPDDVVKYQLRARTMMEWTLLWSRTAIITGLFAMVLLNLYYRVLVDSLPQQAA